MQKQAPPPLISRRKFIALTLGAAASLSLPAVLASCAPAPAPTKTPGVTAPPKPTLIPPTITPGFTLTPVPTPGVSITQPKVISSGQKGMLKTELVVKIKDHTLPGQTAPIQLRTYGSPKSGVDVPNPDKDDDWDWAFPGPTFQIKPKDIVNIKLHNRLPIQELVGECNPITVYPATATPAPAGTATPTVFPIVTQTFPECFHADNVTNMHFHGFHVDQGARRKDVLFDASDMRYGDDVFLALYPKGQMHVHEEEGINNEIGEVEFFFEVPETQSPGTHWYHPHNHGSTDLQVTNGMSGAFIVEDTLNDQFSGAKPADYVFVIQDIAESAVFLSGTNNPTPLVNGEITPNVPMRPGEVQRWRLVNATGKGSNLYSINFDGPAGATPPEIYLIAADGVFIKNEQWDNESPVNQVYLAPGNRIDFLVKAVEAGDFSLNANPLQTNKSEGGHGGGGGGKSELTPTPAATPSIKPVPLMSTTVGGDPIVPAMELPEKLPELIPNLRPILTVDKCQTVEFSVVDSKGPGQAPVFLIDGKSFDPTYIDHCMVLDTAEEWTITNTTTVSHPFHIHLNPFFIEKFDDPNNKFPDPGRRWQDTIIIPAAKGSTPGKVVIRHRFPDIADKFVIHCHILGHEDRGMMQAVEVVRTAAECTTGGKTCS